MFSIVPPIPPLCFMAIDFEKTVPGTKGISLFGGWGVVRTGQRFLPGGGL